MPNMSNCSKCGRFFEVNGLRSLCPTCFEQDRLDFDRIRQYLYEHPHAKMFEVSTNLDISIPQIKRYLREGRLEIVEKDNRFLRCETCGKPICSGYLCDQCSKRPEYDSKAAYIGNSKKASGTGLKYITQK